MYLLIVSLTKKSGWYVDNPILKPNWLSSDFSKLGDNFRITRSNIWARQFEIETGRKLLISNYAVDGQIRLNMVENGKNKVM